MAYTSQQLSHKISLNNNLPAFALFVCKIYVQPLVGTSPANDPAEQELLHELYLYSQLTPSKNIDMPAFQKFSGSNRLHLQTNFSCLTRFSLYNMAFVLKCKYFIPSLLSSLLSVLLCMPPSKSVLYKMSLLVKGSSDSVRISIS